MGPLPAHEHRRRLRHPHDPHHAALLVFQDVAVEHPVAGGVGDPAVDGHGVARPVGVAQAQLRAGNACVPFSPRSFWPGYNGPGIGPRVIRGRGGVRSLGSLGRS